MTMAEAVDTACVSENLGWKEEQRDGPWTAVAVLKMMMEKEC